MLITIREDNRIIIAIVLMCILITMVVVIGGCARSCRLENEKIVKNHVQFAIGGSLHFKHHIFLCRLRCVLYEID